MQLQIADHNATVSSSSVFRCANEDPPRHLAGDPFAFRLCMKRRAFVPPRNSTPPVLSSIRDSDHIHSRPKEVGGTIRFHR